MISSAPWIMPFPSHNQATNSHHQHRPHHRVGFRKANRSDLHVDGEATRRIKRRCKCLDLYKELIPYKEAWSWQKLVEGRMKALIDQDEDLSDVLIILQHPSVYTLGTGSSEKYLNFDIQNAPYEIYRTERGGEVTYHGPGQLVLYPIINLRYHQKDVHWYLRSLEEVVIRVLSSIFSIEASRIEGLTGVWFGNQKVAAIGVRVSRWIASHGLALNVTTDLSPFQHIVPCGIQGRRVGSLSALLDQLSIGKTSDDSTLLDLTHDALLKEFSEVFQLSLEPTSIDDLGLQEENVIPLLSGK